MPRIGIHASHEQIRPSRLLAALRHAEAAGFGAAMCSDHFSPWSERQGESGFAWSWLGAEMYPGRFWVALGTREASNEHITGEPWPDKATRTARLRECVDVMRGLFAGEVVDHDGLVTVDRARLWTLPEQPPKLIGAAVTEATAGWAGEWADGLVTINQPHEQLERVLAAFREGGGEGKPVFLQVHLSWKPDEQRALDVAYDQWRTNLYSPPLSWDLETVEQFDEAARFVRPADVRGGVLVSADLQQHVAWLQELAALGFDAIYLHHVGQELEPFIDAFGESVLPALA